jgi:hypothetical protein
MSVRALPAAAMFMLVSDLFSLDLDYASILEWASLPLTMRQRCFVSRDAAHRTSAAARLFKCKLLGRAAPEMSAALYANLPVQDLWPSAGTNTRGPFCPAAVDKYDQLVMIIGLTLDRPLGLTAGLDASGMVLIEPERLHLRTNGCKKHNNRRHLYSSEIVRESGCP